MASWSVSETDSVPSRSAFGLAWFDTAPAFMAWRREATDFIGISVITSSRLPVLGGEPRLLHGAKVSPNFFDMLNVRAALGRTFDPADAHDTSTPMIITDAL